MSISLKNHEDRIKALENARVRYELDTIFYDPNCPIVGSRQFDIDWDKYDGLIIVASAGAEFNPSTVDRGKVPLQHIISLFFTYQGDTLLEVIS